MVVYDLAFTTNIVFNSKVTTSRASVTCGSLEQLTSFSVFIVCTDRSILHCAKLRSGSGITVHLVCCASAVFIEHDGSFSTSGTRVGCFHLADTIFTIQACEISANRISDSRALAHNPILDAGCSAIKTVITDDKNNTEEGKRPHYNF